MSLTRHLDDLRSPVSQHLNRVFPHVREVRQRADAEARTQTLVLGGQDYPVTTLDCFAPGSARALPDIAPDGVRRYDWTAAGTAFDYRVRLLLAHQSGDDLIAVNGVSRLAALRGDDAPHHWWAELRAVLKYMQSGPDPVARRLPLQRNTEDALARLCGLLAYFEQAHRAPVEHLLNHPLCEAAESDELPEVLALVDPRLVADIAVLADLVVQTQRPWLSAGPSVVSNPTFEASGLLGGADADLIIDGTLLELKTTKNPSLKKTMIYQVLGYLLADSSDRYQLRAVGWYFSRQGYLWSMPVAEFLRRLHGDDVDLSQARADFTDMLLAHQVETPPAVPAAPPASSNAGKSSWSFIRPTVERSVDFYPPATGRGRFHVARSDVVDAARWGHATESVCGARAPLDVLAEPARPPVGQLWALDPRLCRHCLQHTREGWSVLTSLTRPPEVAHTS